MMILEKSFASSDKAPWWSSCNPVPAHEVAKFSSKKYIFECPTCSHKFDATPAHLSNGRGCPFCAKNGKRLCADEGCERCFDRSFASHPKAKHWSAVNNVSPRQVFQNTAQKYFFDCPDCRHRFDQSLGNLVGHGHWCPYCSRKRVCGDVNCAPCFVRSFASHPGARDWSPDNDSTPICIARRSEKICMFRCAQCSTKYKATPDRIVGGQKCPKCHPLSYTTESWIATARAKHTGPDGQPLYDYSSCVYTCAEAIMTIRCWRQDHGTFEVSATRHLCGSGCQKCGRERIADFHRGTFDKFVQKATQVHGDRYTYDRATFISMKKKTCITCPVEDHGPFWQQPANHINSKQGCPRCAQCYTLTPEEFVLAGTDKYVGRYDYSQVKAFATMSDRVVIGCPVHGMFKQTPRAHLHTSKVGCPKCTIPNLHITHDEACQRASLVHNGRYIYLSPSPDIPFRFVNDRLRIVCKRHGEFNQRAWYHLAGGGCPACRNKTEGLVVEFVRSLGYAVTPQKSFEWCKYTGSTRKAPFDLHVPEKGMLIEVDGPQHHMQVWNWTPPDVQFQRDCHKACLALAHGLTVIRISTSAVDDKLGWRDALARALETPHPDPVTYSLYVR